jgi:caffeoyl-CoA O-methyltransferase
MSSSFSLSAPIIAYLAEVNEAEHPALTACRLETARHPKAMMQISAEQGAFMSFLIRQMDVRLAVEVGVFTGYSALMTALALRQNAGPGGKLFAFDKCEEFTDLAKTYWRQAGVESTIDLRIAPASDSLTALAIEGYAGRIDFMFVDADKPGYQDYYEKGLALLRTGGVMMFDNMLWSGSVADPGDHSAETVALRDLAAHAKADPRVRAVLVAIGDGLMLVTKL